MAKHSNPRTAFVFAGGGSLGAVHVGMLQALLEHGYRADFVVGTSIGSINGAFFSCFPNIVGVQGMRRLWGEFRREKHMPVASLAGWFGRSRRNHLLNPEPLRRFVVRQLPCARIEQSEIPCHIVATGLTQAMEVVISEGEWGPAILASCAIPGLFPPVEVRGIHLVDGGMCNNTPISVAIERGAERVVVLPTGSACSVPKPPTTLMGMAMHGVSMMMNRRLLDDCKRYHGRGIVRVLPPVCPLNVLPLDFSQTEKLIESGLEMARKWIQAGGLETDEVPPSLYPHHHNEHGELVRHDVPEANLR